MEYERKLRDDEKCVDDDGGEFSGAVSMHCASAVAAAAILDDDLEAEKQWEKHLGLNQSVIVDSFQGQFKSTVSIFEHSRAAVEFLNHSNPSFFVRGG